ncbi:zinc finger CCCH domain-containing protein 15 homolog [Panonychus citri]|uniref:zinc finger CCCH domain-containing protein 15 homolog n=1 Tax=Panonychus citri TaxID=50023 RepID=UPI0023071E34|nr:zinc finger CCCH domain-containing protein 15 homolog [Panonychus citri]
MPPKKAPPAASKKTEQKKKEKIVEDKTFGLKNKKGAKTQKFIQQVAKCYNANQGKDQPKAASKKEEKRKELEEFNKLFKPVVTQKVEKGVDPKSVICVFFKQGQCSKGDKCKFSHNLAVEKKGEKRNMYEDTRDEDKMEDWDEDKLKDVVEKKHGEKDRSKPKTDIICKFFLEALESSKYGWFWECPNGDKCHYRHALPPGFVLKKDLKKADKKDEISIEDLVEKERAKLDYNLPKITLQSFMEWKKRKIADKKEKSRKETERRRAEYKAGRNIGLSGREMFTFNPELVNDGTLDDDEATFDNLKREDQDDVESGDQIKEIDFSALQSDLRDVDGSGTQISGKRQFNTKDEDEKQQTTEAPLPEATTSSSSTSGVKVDDIPIDENLFDDDEDLDDLEEELSELNVADKS